MRTLVVSDLHLGSHTRHDVLRQAELRRPLLQELDRVDRLVLLGDILELRHGPVRDALAAARGVLNEIGEALGAGTEVVIVPGNHDHHLAEPWLQRRARDSEPPPLGLEAAVDWRPGEALAAIARSLQPASVRAAYPGVWLRGDVYAIHGHYCDRHTTVPMVERLGAGTMARIVHEPAGGPQRAEDYEATLAPVYAWIHAVAQSGGPDLGASSHGASGQAWRALSGGDRRRRSFRRRALIAGFPLFVAALNRARIGPLRADVSGHELRRAALNAIGEVLARLGVGASHVIFGHTHRAGPLVTDDDAEWLTRTGSRLINTGCWVYERQFLGARPRESPYWPGASVLLQNGPGVAPELRRLLDQIPEELLSSARANRV
jgi:predicted phosphodiesterase